MPHPIVKQNSILTFAISAVTAADPVLYGGQPYAVTVTQLVIPCWLKQARPPNVELREGVDRQHFWLRGVALVDDRPPLPHGIEGKLEMDGKTMKFRYHERVIAELATVQRLTGGYPIQGWAILD
jgi:hypothetical protein